MNNIKSLVLSALVALGGLTASAEGCQVNICVGPIIDGDKVPAAINTKMQSQLRNVLARAGVGGDEFESQFFIAGKFDNALIDQVGDNTVVKTQVTIYIGDADNQKVFAAESFDVKGWGNSEERAYIKAMNEINGNNRALIKFVQGAKEKIVDYYNNNYKTYLTKANQAMKSRNYDEALYWATCVPECCVGFNEARELALAIYNHRTDYESANLLAQAQAAWAADPTQASAATAMSYIAQIDPGSSSYAAGQALAKKIHASVKADIDFETKEKYRDEVAWRNKVFDAEHDLESKRIAAARAVGVAWAKNQPKTINRYNFVSHYHGW